MDWNDREDCECPYCDEAASEAEAYRKDVTAYYNAPVACSTRPGGGVPPPGPLDQHLGAWERESMKGRTPW